MRYLMYAIFNNQALSNSPLSGVNNQDVEYVQSTHLTAAISAVDSPEPPMQVAQLKKYQSVIEHLFQDHCLIPMRYGVLFDSKNAVKQTLEESASTNQALLKEIHGCVEMGIRLRVPIKECEKTAMVRPQPKEPVKKTLTGRAYLMSRKDHYQEQERDRQVDDHLVADYTHPFQHLCVRSFFERKEPDPFGKNLAVYFLVPKSQAQPFKRIYHDVSKNLPGKSYLSGPWPPYSFVSHPAHPLLDQLRVS